MFSLTPELLKEIEERGMTRQEFWDYARGAPRDTLQDKNASVEPVLPKVFFGPMLGF